MSKIFITGDTHGGQASDMWKLTRKKWSAGARLSKEDYLIVCGDFGLVWYADESGNSYHKKQQRHYKKWLTERPWTTLFIDGNHENHDMLDALEQVPMFGDFVGKVNDTIFHLKRGRVYIIHGKKFFTMGGAESTDKESRTIGLTWWEQEVPSVAQMDEGTSNLEKHNWEVDYIISHNAPDNTNQRFMSEHNAQGLYNTKINDPVCTYLRYICDTTKFKHLYYGHWHEDWTWDKYTMLYQKIVEIGRSDL